MSGMTRALARLAPYVLGIAGLLMLLVVARSFVGSSGFGYDYAAYDAAARRVATGLPLYPPGTAEAYNAGSYDGLYLYPPPLAVWLVPLTALGPVDATLAWLWIRIATLAAACAILPISWTARAATFAAASISFPVWYDLNLGNLSVLLVGLSALIWRFRETPVGGVALAVAGILRYPFAIVGLAWVLRRRWGAVVTTVGAGLVLAAITVPVVGLGAWGDYAAIVRGLGNVSAGPHNLSLATTAAELGVPGPPALWVAAQIAIAAAATAFAALRRDGETAAVVALAATILFFPFFHPHYLAQLVIPAGFLAGRGQWWGLALPLLGWLPGTAMPLVAIAACFAPLLPPGWGAVRRSAAVAAAPRDAGMGFGTGPTRP